MNEITALAVAKAALAKARQYPERTNPGSDAWECFHFYPESGRAACLFGHALSMVGVTPQQRGRWSAGGIDTVGIDLGWSYDDTEPLSVIQNTIDKGKPWADAIPLLEHVIAEHGETDDE